MISAGPRDQRVTLQRFTTTVGPFGQKIITWTDVGTYWAQVRPASGQERLVGQNIQAETTHAVNMLMATEITQADRLVFEGRILNIKQAINVNEKNVEYRLMCLEVIDGQ